MDNKKEIFGYQGIFFDDIVRKELIKFQQKGLNENIINIHVTFNYGRLYKFPENIVGKEVEVIIVGYGSDGLNSGFAVEMPEELNKFYKNKSVAHITVSLGEVNGIKGKAVDKGKLQFNKLDKILKIKGRVGYFLSGVVVFDNSIFN